ncbi:flagellin [Sporomusa acidovorans]|uniref:Flagellin C-terminal domain-containing protein n=1 Tax=Sporomusa acidovorans (strain ATCC 49682 / DSM 3132 / Mol) TaxID=1123286 RepID=A0ABZ3JC91_SPOA4|nr:flagellin [Sporomusa acidovorans]OZC18595.1 flagellin [Sporomusa acidovorans DSM 3132]SDF52282.1 flagellin C-terminal helical region [Sporomusa acidovorans]
MPASIADTSAKGLSLSTDVSTQAAAATTLTSIDSALQQLSSNRSHVGAVTNGLAYSSEYTAQAEANLASAYSGYADSDIALAAMNLNQAKIQSYVNIMALSKTMNMQKGVLSLLV